MECREKNLTRVPRALLLPGKALSLLLVAKEDAVAVELGEGEEGRRKLEEEEGGRMCIILFERTFWTFHV